MTRPSELEALVRTWSAMTTRRDTLAGERWARGCEAAVRLARVRLEAWAAGGTPSPAVAAAQVAEDAAQLRLLDLGPGSEGAAALLDSLAERWGRYRGSEVGR